MKPLNTCKALTTALLGSTLLGPAVQAGDVKVYAAAGICDSNQAVRFTESVEVTGTDGLIRCGVPRDLPQKGKVHKVQVIAHFDSREPARSTSFCDVTSGAIDSTNPTHYDSERFGGGAVGIQKLTFTNFKAVKHGWLALRCYLPEHAEVISVLADE